MLILVINLPIQVIVPEILARNWVKVILEVRGALSIATNCSSGKISNPSSASLGVIIT